MPFIGPDADGAGVSVFLTALETYPAGAMWASPPCIIESVKAFVFRHSMPVHILVMNAMNIGVLM